MSVRKPESGLRNHRVEFAIETTDETGVPQPPQDPSWEPISDRIYSHEWSPSAALEPDRGLSDVDPDTHNKSPEEHETTVSYALQRWLTDGTGSAGSPPTNGSPHDLSGYGVIRDSDNLLPATLTVVDREDKGTIQASSTINGTNQKSTRIYTVAIGVKVSNIEITLDPSDQQPVVSNVTLAHEYGRKHQIDQPDSSTTLDVVSSDSNDTSQSVVIENEGATTSETVSLNGTTTVSTTESFGDIDAIYITDGSGNPTDTVGNVTVSESAGDDLAVIQGSSEYDDVEGDYGVPALGAGSHASEIGTDFYRTLQDTISIGGSSTYWMEINSKSLTVDNNINRRMRDASYRMAVEEGIRDATLGATVYGETQSFKDMERSLSNRGADILWTFVNGEEIQLSNAKLDEPGSPTYEAEQTQMTLDNSFSGEGGGRTGLYVYTT